MNRSSVFETLGNVELLSQKKIAVFASKNAPDDLRSLIKIFFDQLFKMPVSLAGGWQSPLEKSVYAKFNWHCSANLIHYIAKDINQYKPTEQQQNLVDHNKLLFVAPELKEIRANSAAVDKRDRLIFSQNKNILFLYIEPKGRLEKYFRELSQLNFHLYVLDHPVNKSFFYDDVIPLNEDSIQSIIL